MVSKDTCRSRREIESACSYLKRPETPSTLDKNAGGNDRRRRFANSGEPVWFRSKRVVRETTEGAPFLIVAIIIGGKGVYH